MRKKTLVCFDLNCLLGYVAPIRNFMAENSIYSDYKPHKTLDGFNVFLRPNLDYLLNSIHSNKDHYDIGIWSCQDKANTALQINAFLGNLKYNLKLALFTPKPISAKEEEKFLPAPVDKDLNIIFKKHEEYDAKNVLIVSNYKNKNVDFRGNDIVLPLYHPSLGQTSFTLDAHMYYLGEFLQIVNAHKQQNKIDDVRDVLKQLNYEKLVKLRSGSTKPDRQKWDLANTVRF